jgi:hypothetical protein
MLPGLSHIASQSTRLSMAQVISVHPVRHLGPAGALRSRSASLAAVDLLMPFVQVVAADFCGRFRAVVYRIVLAGAIIQTAISIAMVGWLA